MIKIHSLSDVQSLNIGDDTNIWQFCVILPNAKIGKNCNICANVLIENDVVIGDNVTIKCGIEVCDGITIEDDVFIGPNVTFTNDFIPRSKKHPIAFARTVVRKGASIGANVALVPGITIGEYSFIGTGSVVTKSIPAYTVWYGNPAKHKGYITKEGVILDFDRKDTNGIIHNI